MPVPSLISDLSQTAASNFPQGSDSPSNLDDTQRAHGSFIAMLRDGKGFTNPVTLASAATVDIGGQNSLSVEITGTTTITSFGTTYNGPRFLRFTGALILTYNATTLSLPTAASITTVAGDTCLAIPNSAQNGWNVVYYQRASGAALVTSTDYLNTTRINVASATTTDLTANAPNTRNISITGVAAITAFTVAIGQTYFVSFASACTLTNNAAIVTNTGANIVTAAGDSCILRSTAANTVEVLNYVPATPLSNRSGRVLKVQQFSDVGSSTTSTSAVNLNVALWNYTPVSNNSTLFLILSGQCYATALASGAGFCYFWIGEYTGAYNVRSSAAPLQNQQYSTTYAQQIYVPLAIQCSVSNAALTTRQFDIMGASFNAGVTAGASGTLTVIEVAN